MRVYVTGSTGFIGTALTTALRNTEHRVVDAVERCDAVIHLAGIAHRKASVRVLYETNVALTERLASLAASVGARFLFISSVKVLGEGGNAPLRDTSPVAPADRYAESKAHAEEALRSIANLRLTILRPPLVYGPGVKANFLALLTAVARGWPLPFAALHNRRSFIFVGNLVDAIIRCLDVEGTFLVSDGSALSTGQLCRELGKALGRPARLFPFPPALLPRKLAGSLKVDDSTIRTTLGWWPPFTRQAGLQATADWYHGR